MLQLSHPTCQSMWVLLMSRSNPSESLLPETRQLLRPCVHLISTTTTTNGDAPASCPVFRSHSCCAGKACPPVAWVLLFGGCCNDAKLTGGPELGPPACPLACFSESTPATPLVCWAASQVSHWGSSSGSAKDRGVRAAAPPSP